ncbi:MAG: tetratricopeptide repeat protein [Planctomycetota bacterium]
MDADPGIAHGSNWEAAWKHVDARVAAQAPLVDLEACLAATAAMAQAAPLEIVQTGAGWGALENLRRRRAGETPVAGPALPFDAATLGPEQAPWLSLVEEETLPAVDPAGPPASFMNQEHWQRLLERAITMGRSDHWYAWLQLGVLHLGARRFTEARKAWETSLERTESKWAHRNLGRLAAHEQNTDDAVRHYRRAMEMDPADLRVFIEFAEHLIVAGRPALVLEAAGRPASVHRRVGRVRLLEARAAVDTGRLELVPALIDEPCDLTDAREGDAGPSGIWFDYHAKRLARETGRPFNEELRQEVMRTIPPPPHLDYRMGDY